MLLSALYLLKESVSLCLLLALRCLKVDLDLQLTDIINTLNGLREEKYYSVVLAALQFSNNLFLGQFLPSL